MSTNSLKDAIVHAARECEDCMRLAAFAESDPSLGSSIAIALRKFATYHSRNAFSFARTLHVRFGSAA